MKKLVSILISILIFSALCIPAFAISDISSPDGEFILNVEEPTEAILRYVTDDAGLLSDEEWSMLEAKAESISNRYKCGVYIVTLEDYRNFGDSPHDASKTIYQECSLGIGDDKDGIMLMLSMAERDYWILCHGYGNVAFNDYGRDKLDDEFLDNFGDDDWAGGFEDYLNKSESMLSLARDGKPLSLNSDPGVKLWGIVISILLGLIIALIVCLILRSSMKSVFIKAEAKDYIPDDGGNITVRRDIYTHSTEIRKKIERDSGNRTGSDGFSGSGGKF